MYCKVGVSGLKEYILIAGVNGTGKSSFRGVLENIGTSIGYIIDPNVISAERKIRIFSSCKQALKEIQRCLKNNITFTQETTLSGHQVKSTILKAKKQGYIVTMYHMGLNTKDECLYRIANRVRKGGHDIPPDDVIRRFTHRFEALDRVVTLCDKVIFYDNENGFIKVAEITDGVFCYTNGYRPDWIVEYHSHFLSE